MPRRPDISTRSGEPARTIVRLASGSWPRASKARAASRNGVEVRATNCRPRVGLQGVASVALYWPLPRYSIAMRMV